MSQNEKQIVHQLSRMSVLGKIEPNQIPEYVRSLSAYSESDISEACGTLIDSWTNRYFPRPADIRDVIQRMAARRASGGFDHSGSKEMTTLFLAAFWRCFALRHKEDFDVCINEVIRINERYGDNNKMKMQALNEYGELVSKISSLPQKLSDDKKQLPKAIPGRFQVKQPVMSSISDSDMPF